MPVFRYTLNDTAVEHRINVSDAGVLQSFVVSGVQDDIVFEGSSEWEFTSPTGKRESDDIRFPKADELEFEVEIQHR